MFVKLKLSTHKIDYLYSTSFEQLYWTGLKGHVLNRFNVPYGCV